VGDDPSGCIWHLYSGSNTTGRTNSKWNIPPSSSSTDPAYHPELAEMIRSLDEKHSGDISYAAFGATTESTPNCIFWRSTDVPNDWRYRWSIGALPLNCEREIQASIVGGGKYDKSEGDSLWIGGRLRAVTFGYNDCWILYGHSEFAFGGLLPEELKAGLSLGEHHDWSINVCVMAD